MLRRTLLLLPLALGVAEAQEPFAEEPVDARRYTVEMIVFSYAEGISAGTEIFVPDKPPAAEIGESGEFDTVSSTALQSQPEVIAEPIVEEALGESLDELGETPVPYDIVMLANEDFTLLDVYEHLERLSAYEPLLHFGWTQSTYADQETEPRPLSAFVTPPDGLDGDLNLYLSRYLHLAVNLQMDAPATNVTFNPISNKPELSYPVRYRINEDRIFRNGELRYFDHPRFGVLAKITRVEEAEDDTSADTELLGY
ncbi:MAG TPA: CsiV family protein [Woeseiaceae bacterium]|nr:CsiV family protein [Woeseiaceae bacterium]